MEDIENINPRIYTLSAVIIGFLLIEDFSANEQNAIANWLMLVGQLLESNAAQQQAIESRIYGSININSKINKCFYDPFIYDLNKIKEVLNNTTPDNTGHVIDLLQKFVLNLEKHINEIKK